MNIALLTAIGMSIAAFFNQIKSIFQYLAGILIKTHRINLYPNERIVYLDFINKNTTLINYDEYDPTSSKVYNKELDMFESIIYKDKKREIRLYKCFPIIITYDTITYIRFTFPFESIIQKISEIEKTDRYYYEAAISGTRFIKESTTNMSTIEPRSNNNSIGVYTVDEILKIQPQSIFGAKPKLENISDMFIIDENNLAIEKVFKSWLDSEMFYKRIKYPWRSGLCLYGKPGNGKSAIVRYLAKKYKIPIHILDLSSFTNKDFDNFYLSQPTIILIEDIDNIFKERENLTKMHTDLGLTFDKFINWMSDEKNTNVFLVITTNKIDFIDSAILRAGRIDHTHEINPLNIDKKKEMASMILSSDEDIEKCLINSEQLSNAEFKKKCVELAIRKFHEK